MQARKMGRTVRELLVYGLVGAILIMAIFPICWMILSAFKPTSLTFAIPPAWVFEPSLENFQRALGGGRGWSSSLPHYFFNSVLVATTTTVITVTLGAMAGHVLARYRTGGETLPLGFLFARMMPALVLILPLYLIIKTANLIDNPISLIVTYTAFNLPFAVWMARGFFNEVPQELEEASRVDGCTRWQSFTRVAVPLAIPGLATTTVLIFITAWNEFLFALLLTSLNGRTAPVAASLFITDEAILWGPITATGTLIISVPIILTLILQRHIVRGLMEGALK